MPANLPFIKLDGDHIDYWNTEQTGKWNADNQLGHDYAMMLCDCMRAKSSPFLLGHVVKAMINKRRFEGVECGFMHSIAELVMR